MTECTTHKSGFVSIIGRPNAGKSTLMNVLVGEKLSIISPKAQTTRHRILGIRSESNYQIVFSDTPGIIRPVYELQHSMMQFVKYALEDADILLVIQDATQADLNAEIKEYTAKLKIFKILVINKIDLLKSEELELLMQKMQGLHLFNKVIPISATSRINTDSLLEAIVQELPVHPAYYEYDYLSDRNERFFVSEILREKIFLNFEQEIPYSCEVLITNFKEKPEINVISADIIVERDSQKGILIGKHGSALKKLASEARVDMEKFFNKKVFLECHVRVAKDWRKNKALLGKFGYITR